jgi:tetratricopeptide (TPR) repeat protein
MVNLPSRLKLTVAASALAMGILPTLLFGELHQTELSAEVADEAGAERDMPALMAALAEADPAEAERLAGQIRHKWDASGSASADFLLTRARKALEAEDLTAALEHATALTDHAPAFAQGWAVRARTFYALDQFGLALNDLEHVLALNPRHFDAIMGLAVMLDQMGRPEDAYKAYLQVKAIHPHLAGLTEALERLAPQVRGKSL